LLLTCIWVGVRACAATRRYRSGVLVRRFRWWSVRRRGGTRTISVTGAVIAAGALVGGGLVVASAGTASAAPACVAAGSHVTCSYPYNGSDGTNGSAQTFVVPAGVTRVTVHVWGASGPDAPTPPGGSPVPDSTGGLGGHAGANIPVTPGEKLRIRVGGDEGFNSGDDDGGGATDVRQGGDALTNRIIVAGGGGQGGLLCADVTEICQGFRGGDGGGAHGGDDSIQLAGGGGPTSGGSSAAGVPGSFGAGGNDGGGGGWYGGGGGGFIEPGSAAGETAAGGGSGFVTPAATGPRIDQTGINTGNGKATIAYTPPPAPDFVSVVLRCTNLRVGYVHFPAGTNVDYAITGGGTSRATGHFTTKAGSQFLTVPLATPLPPDGQPTLAVHLDWQLNGTAFSYVRSRNSGCST
jgi:hypothetical protein